MPTTNSELNQELINHIRTSVDIVEIISDYIPLTKKGKNYFGVCPFHSDHSPSMSVSQERQIYKCFSCGAAGNIFKFLMDYENISFKEALKKIADKAGITISLNISTPKENKSYQKLYEIFQTSQLFYQNNINTKEGKKAKDYLQSRNINSNIISEFEIGLALKNNTMLSKILQKKGYQESDLVKTGLVNKNGLTINDVYYNRIMFPLWDLTGHIVGYSGRIYDTGDTSKYINTKETEIFKKGELLYHYHKAKDEARKQGKIIIVEGFMDVIRCSSIGIQNVVATMGTAITPKQALLMKRLGKEILLCFDGDEAGAKATMSCIDELSKIGIIPKVIRLEENLDPDEYIQKYGETKFRLKLDSPINIMDFKLSYLKKGKNLKDNIEVSKYLNNMIEEINKIDDPILQELTLNKLSEEYHIDIQTLKDQIKKPEKKTEIKKKKNNDKSTKYIKAERNLLYYMLEYEEVLQIYKKNVVFLPTERYRKLAREIDYFYKENEFIKLADIMTFVSENETLTNTINEILNLNLKEDYTKEEIEDYINTIQEFNLKTEQNRLKRQIQEEIDPIKKAKLAQRIVEIKNMR